MQKILVFVLAVVFSTAGFAQTTKDPDAKNQDSNKQNAKSLETSRKIPPNAKFFLGPMGGFEEDLKTAIAKKKVPVVLVTDKEKADYEITGTSDTEKASAAKKVLLGNWHSDEQASITVTERKSGEVVFAYSVNKKSSAHGKRSTAEACAKHLKEVIEGS
jgi:hypothetical protein